MAVSSTTATIQYAGNNSTVTEYAVPFYFLDDTHLEVIVTTSAGVETTLTEGSQYTVIDAGEEAGGAITTATAYDNTHTVTISRAIPVKQETEYTSGSAFPAASHETALDKLTMVTQELKEKIKRCVRLSMVADESDPLASEINTIFGINESGEVTLLDGTSILAMIELPETVVDKPTAFWENDAARALKVPDFIGQFGMQFSGGATGGNIYVSNGTTAGSWAAPTLHNSDVTAAKLASDAVTTSKILNSNVTTAKIADSNVTTAKIADGNVTAAKMGTTGMVLQSVSASYTANTNLTTAIPLDDTIPQITEGTEILSVTITPTSTTNKIRLRFTGCATADDSGDTIIAAIFDGSTNAIHATGSYPGQDLKPITICSEHTTAAVGALTAKTFTVRVGGSTSGIRMNGSYSARYFGGVAASTLVAEEIKA